MASRAKYLKVLLCLLFTRFHIINLLIVIYFDMPTSLPAPPRPVGDYTFRQNLMVGYASTNYHYIITPEEAEEIANKPFWTDVDAFCDYMMHVNFGEPIPGTNNVRLPSTMRIYTDAELDAMDAGIMGLSPTTTLSTAYRESYTTDTGLTVRHTLSNTNTDPELPISTDEDYLDFDGFIEVEFEGEFLPLYTPEVLPVYKPSATQPPLPLPSLAVCSANAFHDTLPEEPPPYTEEEHESREDAPEEDLTMNRVAGEDNTSDGRDDHENETEKAKTKGASLHDMTLRLGRKLKKAQRKMVKEFDTLLPKKAVNWTRQLRRKTREISMQEERLDRSFHRAEEGLNMSSW
ncbi:hypothetical protein M426DRAFT_17962 [Hypoxylon sp. CI-4A]|nr:hypothetical protein M426DRAFT_17962 [Hypoxylon sp. CI-4A]